MSFQVILDAQLCQSSLVGTLGYQALDSGAAVVQAFTKTGVVAGTLRGCYTAGTVTLPDTAVKVQWGLDNGSGGMGTVLAEERVSNALAAAQAKLQTLGTGLVSSTAPVDAEGNVRLTRGDDYYAADGRALEWSDDAWPNLTGGSVQFTVRSPATLQVVGSIVVAGSGLQTVRVELSRAQTAVLSSPRYVFDLIATLADGNKATLVEKSPLLVTERVGS